jgi:NAD(P)-dependent dehydrogenase (short-subunit alcohol dehydrogenase family)
VLHRKLATWGVDVNVTAAVVTFAITSRCDLSWCDAECFPEGLPKMSRVGVAQASGDLGDRTVGVLQQPKRAFHAPRGDVSMGSEPGGAPEEKAASRVAQQVRERFGRCDILINNAAVHYDTWETATRADFQIVHEVLETNVVGAWRLAAALVPLMREGRYGRIVNVSSEAGSLASMAASAPAYAVSKAALNALTRVLASELRGTGVLVNSVCPGWVATDMGGRGGRPVEQGAAGIVWAATLPMNGPTGGFFRDGAPLPW